ncbi:hypothetical protein M5689_006378 [Euphorbia peplus]|nr:hypothetical protein M5689_006378 [Euphorbia peplus]
MLCPSLSFGQSAADMEGFSHLYLTNTVEPEHCSLPDLLFGPARLNYVFNLHPPTGLHYASLVPYDILCKEDATRFSKMQHVVYF